MKKDLRILLFIEGIFIFIGVFIFFVVMVMFIFIFFGLVSVLVFIGGFSRKNTKLVILKIIRFYLINSFSFVIDGLVFINI